MDSINVATSLVGLLGSAGRVVVLLLAVKKSIGEAPRMMDQMVSQVRELEICLSAVQSFLLGISSAPRRRISMIRVEQLVAILTEAVLTFSELEVLVTSIAKDKGRLPITSRLTTLWKEDVVTSIMLRLERHKSSLSLMLNIAQCESDVEAEQSRETLQSLVEQLLRSNHDISLRLQSIEENFETGSVITHCFRNGSMPDFPEGEVHAEQCSQLEFSKVENVSRGSNLPTEGCAGYRSGFEVDLGTSRVYRRTELSKSDVSFTSSAIRSHAWSIFSGLSLSEVSMLSAIALPLYLNEIYNNKWYNTLSPRPLVEDDMKSLARESSTSHIPTYEPPVRGIVEQHPIILEACVTPAEVTILQAQLFPTETNTIPEGPPVSIPNSDTYSPRATETEAEEGIDRTTEHNPIASLQPDPPRKDENQDTGRPPTERRRRRQDLRSLQTKIHKSEFKKELKKPHQESTPSWILRFLKPPPQRPAQVTPGAQFPTRPQRAARSGKMVLYKLVVLGDGNVGKTGLIMQFALHQFVDIYDPTIEDSYRKQAVIDGQLCMLEILDTTGQEEYTALRDQWIRDGEGFVLVYSIDDRSSFTRIQSFHDQVRRIKGSTTLAHDSLSKYEEDIELQLSPLDFPIMLVGHNCDRLAEREVSKEEGQALARELGCEFLEASAKNCINVEKTFYDPVRILRRQRLQNAVQTQRESQREYKFRQKGPKRAISLFDIIRRRNRGRRP